jgi:hypothetical protein
MTDPDPGLYIANRCADAPRPQHPSERLRCAQCACDVWIDPLRYIPVKLAQSGSLRVVCLPCATDRVLNRYRATGRPA